MSLIKRSAADDAFSKCIRERAAWTCERCRKKYPENSQGLHCSHHFSRRHRSIRWCADNAMALCYSCHQWYGGNPLDSASWLEGMIGAKTINKLRQKINNPVKVSKGEEKQIADFYRQQFVQMKDQRTAGKIGRLEFESYQ